MLFIKEDHEMQCNLLKLTEKEYKELEPFLIGLGVRSRVTEFYSETNSETGKPEDVCIIQAQNVYQYGSNTNDRKLAESLLSDDAVAWYKR